jgi:hypothetical protein
VQDQRLLRAAIALVAVQIVHGAIPAKTKAEGHVGLVLGAIALVASVAAVFGLRARRPWARLLLGVTGAAVAVGFVLYHSLPVHSAVTNPYFGTKGIGALQWAPVIGAIGIGAWAALEARRPGTTAGPLTADGTSVGGAATSQLP